MSELAGICGSEPARPQAIPNTEMLHIQQRKETVCSIYFDLHSSNSNKSFDARYSRGYQFNTQLVTYTANCITMLSNIDEQDNLARMRRGELYYAFSPQLVGARRRCGQVVGRFNRAGDLTRREIAEYWKE